MTRFLRISHPQEEGILRVSKALKHPVLLSSEEMRSLFDELGNFSIYDVSGVVSKETAEISHEEFLTTYNRYIESLKSGQSPSVRDIRRAFSAVFTADDAVLYAMEVGKEKYLVKPIKPVIQLQMHFFMYSLVDHKFHTMNAGQNSVSWGIQFSYPQIYQDPKQHTYSKIDESSTFPNTSLYRALSKWVRYNTTPTKCEVEGKVTNQPFRIGKKCHEWISFHPDLNREGIKVLG